MGSYNQQWNSESCQQYGACNLKGRVKYKRLCIGKDNVELAEQYCEGINFYYEECTPTFCLGKWEIFNQYLKNLNNQ